MDIQVVELRQYSLLPGRRDDLVAVFDAELVHTQEQCGIAVIGQYADVERPDRFVWLRGFASMGARRDALGAFYGGPAWAEHGPTANDTMVAWDDVLLLEPVRPLALTPSGDGSDLVVTVHPAGTPTADDDVLALQTLHADNTFPALPVRPDADVVVRVRRDETAASLDVLQVVRARPTPGSHLR